MYTAHSRRQCYYDVYESLEDGYWCLPISGHTTMSSLSPQSRRLDNDKCSYSLLPGARTTVPVNVLPLRPEYTGGSGSNNANATKAVMSPLAVKKPIKQKKLDPLAVKKPIKQKKLESAWTSCSWRCLTYALAIALIFCLAVICFLLVPLLSAGSLNGAGGSYSGGASVFGDSGPAVSSARPLRPLPESFDLGEEVVADLPPGVFVYTYFTVQRDARVSFNLSVEPQAKLVLYGRQTVVPSPTAHDFVEIVRGDRLHLGGGGGSGDRRKRRINYGLATSNMRSTILLHYLLAGRWHLGFLNDGAVPQTVRFIAALSDDRVDDCKYDCYGKGICKDGKCFCHRGFSGPHCEETSCPVLCSGNGLFAGGRCHCHQGWKGADCDVPAHVCEVPNCSGHGTCGNDGRCLCDRDFSGQFCDQRACPSEDCSGHGVCVDGKCYCEFGWKNENCDDAYTSQSMCSGGGAVVSRYDAACSNHGVFDHETSSCLCDRDFTGDRCQTENCPVACIHGACKEAVCACDAGWMGDQCDTVSLRRRRAGRSRVAQLP
uniref:EGF-like domain-containing protein n=1 Tax=Plectus sambesii TaxID=2011161 RepID=A0A914UIL9_9BILA